MKKTILALCIILTILFGTVVPASADGELGTSSGVGEESRMRYLDYVGADVFINESGVATTTAEAISFAEGLTNLLVVAELQKQVNGNWTTLRTYRYFTADSSVYISQTCEVSRGYYYRVVNTATAYVGNDSETEVLETPSWNYYVPTTN